MTMSDILGLWAMGAVILSIPMVPWFVHSEEGDVEALVARILLWPLWLVLILIRGVRKL